MALLCFQHITCSTKPERRRDNYLDERYTYGKRRSPLLPKPRVEVRTPAAVLALAEALESEAPGGRRFGAADHGRDRR